MNIHMRGPVSGTVLLNNDNLQFLNTKTDSTISNCIYPYWHPSGEYIAYSVNKIQQAFHEIKTKRVEVVDLESDIVVYNIKANKLISCKLIKAPDSFETFPSFSPDGRRLYFCTAKPQKMPDDYNQIRYNLCAIDFNPENGTFGSKVDTLVNAEKMKKSVSFPRPSYDGKYLMYTLSDYGNFSIWHKEADLWLLDLKTNQTRAITEVNSNDVDSYHSWSSNSRWFVFSSRRIDGLYTRPFIASIDNNGKITKPFLLPQQDPDFYERLLFSFNIPEFVNDKVELDVNKVEELTKAKPKQVEYAK
jgi:Tol biopolymer transport system component